MLSCEDLSHLFGLMAVWEGEFVLQALVLIPSVSVRRGLKLPHHRLPLEPSVDLRTSAKLRMPFATPLSTARLSPAAVAAARLEQGRKRKLTCVTAPRKTLHVSGLVGSRTSFQTSSSARTQTLRPRGKSLPVVARANEDAGHPFRPSRRGRSLPAAPVIARKFGSSVGGKLRHLKVTAATLNSYVLFVSMFFDWAGFPGTAQPSDRVVDQALTDYF